MSGNRNPMERLKDKVKEQSDRNRTGYQRVQSRDIVAGSDGSTLSTPGTTTTLDLIQIEDNPRTKKTQISEESDEFNNPPIEFVQTQKQILKQQQSQELRGDPKSASNKSLKGSKVSFDQPAAAGESSDEDSFEDKRDQFQQQKTISVDHKGILKDLKTILANDNRKAFQSKKHVSLDVKGTFLEDLLKESSSEEEFRKNRSDFQGRKHQSLDPRVSFKLEKALLQHSTSSDEEDDIENKSLISEKRRYKDTTKPFIIDFKDLVSDDDEEDLISTRKSFQQQRSISVDSRKSHRFYEMDEIGGSKKSENLRNSVPYIRQITEDGKPKLEVYRPTTNPIYYWTQLIAALSVSMGSLVVGFSSAYSSPALESMKDGNVTSFEVSSEQASWVGGLMPLAGLVGGVCGGPLIEYVGRKHTILATAVPFIISWIMIACAVNIELVLAGRALAGLCVGVASLSLPVYLGETIQPEVRGTLGLLPTAFGNIGILLCYLAGTYLNWSQLAFLGSALPVPFLILTFMIPETPHWYVSSHREDRARKALKWLRGKKADVEPELKGIIKGFDEAEKTASKNQLLELLKKSNLKPLSISLGLMFFQQLSGINAVIFYTVTIFKDAGSTIDENLSTVIIGIVNFIATFIATVLIDRLGRKMLLYISGSAMVVTLGILGAFFYCKNAGMDVSAVGWLPLASLVIYVLGFSLGYGPIPWLMMGEILPSKIRGSAASVATGFNWTCTFIVTKSFTSLISGIGSSGTFWLFGVVCFVGIFFVRFCVPETRGKTLEDIERKMMGRVRRMSSVANLKPLAFNM